MGGGTSRPSPGRFTPRTEIRYPFLQEAGWAPGPVWTGADYVVPTGIRSPDRPAHNAVAIPTALSRVHHVGTDTPKQAVTALRHKVT